MTRTNRWLILVALLIGVCVPLFMTSHAAAASPVYLQDELIDDGVFLDANSMTPDQIQAFLTSLHSSLATYTTVETLPTYANYNRTVSAAQVIWDVGQVYGLNPQVIISTLQKEESLITDPSPSNSQMNFAMGYGCADSTGCSKYAGFFNQVDNGSWQLRFNYERARGNSGWWNSSLSYPCGGSTRYYKPGLLPGNNVTFYDDYGTGYVAFTIQNPSTASLYCYTPHAYPGSSRQYFSGSYNFVVAFNNWFGSTIGSLVRTPSNPTLYYSDGLSKYIVGSMDMAAQYNFGLGNVRIVSDADLNAIPLASSPDTPTLSYVVKSDSDSDSDGGTIYFVNRGVRYPITSMTQFANFGFTLDQLGYMPLTDLLRMPVGANLSNYISGPDGFVYQVSSNVRHGIYDGSLLSQLNPSGNITPVSSLVVNSIPLGTALLTGNAVMIDPDGSVYLVNNSTSTWYHVTSMNVYNCLGLGNLPNIYYRYGQTTIGTVSNNISCLTKTSGGQNYIMDGWRRIPADPSWGFSTFNQIGDSFITGVPVYNPSSHPVFRTPYSGALYALVGGKKDQVISMDSFYGNGYTANDIFTVATGFLSEIPTGPFLLTTGLDFQDAATGKLYAISGSNKLYIPSMATFTGYGFNPNAIYALDSASLAAYPTTGNLSSLANLGSTPSLLDSGIVWQTSDSTVATAFGFNGSTPTYSAAISRSARAVKPLTQYVKFSSSPTLYYMQGGQKRPVYSMSTFTSLGGASNLSNLTILSDSAADLFPSGPSM